jgi:3-oxoacyl-[acyl-carrier-protein] synthase II
MPVYIRSIASISPFSHPAVSLYPNAITCADPDLSNIIDAKLTRRMSHVIKMGMGAAMQAIQGAGNVQPDAIITGTAYGCLDDTGVFLKKQVLQNESMLTPTAFIQSTHNTVGGQIGLMLQCHGYNNTFVHRGFSFEHALQDAVMLLEEKNANDVLVGAVDEITTVSHALLSRFGLYKNMEAKATPLPSKGTIAGEGAAFFILSNDHREADYGILKEVGTLYKPTIDEVRAYIASFLAGHSLSPADIDIIIAGKNGDETTDKIYDSVLTPVFPGTLIVNFKHQSGEYPTATGFALWKAAAILKQKAISEEAAITHPVKNILIYNHYQNIHHTFQLVTPC